MPRDAGFRADERGGTSLEYALIAALTAIVMTTGVKLADITFDARAEQLAAAFGASKGGADVAAATADEEVITGSIRRREDK